MAYDKDMLEQLEAYDDLADELDYDFSINEVIVNTFDEFRTALFEPFLDPSKQLFYRGERINSLKRPLIPTMFRDRSKLIGDNEFYANVDADYLLDFYKDNGEYYNLFCSVFGEARKYSMYEICAFSQHYLNCSPFIDFSKSLYVALSFALKGKSSFTDDGILYTVEINDPENYTTDRVTAECWLNEYFVRVYDNGGSNKNKSKIEKSSPEAKLIDIATNDRMKFQQGVFLLLNNFNLVNKLYLTKKVRSSVKITKHILNKELCPQLTELVTKEAPWYSFDNLLDISEGIQTAIDYNRSSL